tara:strand:- start:115 stop:327 length:213 start_codon:yes stop_codon:yes gene_type:complete
MSIFNYFLIGVIFTFVIDLILLSNYVRNHPKMKNVIEQNWSMAARITCMIIWPLAAVVFISSFIKQFFKK